MPAVGCHGAPRTELFERTHDAELGHLLEFFYDEVVSAELGDEEFTYDLSVPSNVTYVANGFVSHNTIGLMMDCDTTGIEPDLALTKAKKLVGGGTMMIVNQTIPRALANLGYSPEQADDIVAHINEQKTIFGAPHFKAEHLPVFACSMGDNTIHYMGHVKMMGAVQPFLSGAISKTVNMPEEATIEDVEELHLEAWKLGMKAVALYRDNCKVAQPLATQKKGGETGSPEALANELVNGTRRRWSSASSSTSSCRSRCVRSCRACATRRRSRSGWPTATGTRPSVSSRTVVPVRCSSRSPSRVPPWPGSWTRSRSR